MINRRTLKEVDKAEIVELFPRKPVTPAAAGAARDAIARVRAGGDDALRELTKKYDGVELDSLEVGEAELRKAEKDVPQSALRMLERAKKNIENFHAATRPKDWEEEFEPGVFLGVRYLPFKTVGAYVPGGRAAYPSTALMCLVPAKVAGVENVVACTPPGPNGDVPALTLAALRIAGADRVFRVGGAQAIAALACGTGTVPRVEKIVGPGNEYVTAAKMEVRGEVEIDFPAGPSEVFIVADDSARPVVVAAEMVAQGEHDPRAMAYLACTSEKLAGAVNDALERELDETPRGSIARQSTYELVVVPNAKMAVELSNIIAPEHLVLMTAEPQRLLPLVKAAGAVFIGHDSPVAAGDYAAGPNHVLPTGGEARLHSGLNVAHFLRCVTTVRTTGEGLQGLKDTICGLARLEGLEGHARSVERRFQ